MFLRKFPFLLLFVLSVSINNLFAQDNGDIKNWSMDDFMGLDDVQDCMAETGNISSVFARKENDTFIFRVTFDNMVERKNNKVVKDAFLNKNIKLYFSIYEKENYRVIQNELLDIDKIENEKEGFSLLRTLNDNKLEVFLPWNQEYSDLNSIAINIKIELDGKIVDEFDSNHPKSKSGGNCAFVHHGNQGLTYTNVFYGDAGGLSGLDGSGFDEILQVHEATQTPGNFHMSGTLIPAAEWHNPEFNDWLTSMAGDGTAAMMTSALGQHIMSFTSNEMNDWSVYVETQMVNYRYGYFPKVAWVPERVWLAPGYDPDAGVLDWLGDNWTNHGIEAVVLDDWPHLNGYDNTKIHWMNNGSGVNLRVIPINNDFVGNMHYNAQAAKDQIASMGQYNICVYGTDWEVAAEMNEHDGTQFLDNYESVLWYCHDNYPAVNVWKLDAAINNPDFNGTGANITKGTYGLLGGTDGYGGSNNSWYSNWASTPSHSDFHSPQWDYGTVWWDAYNFLMSVPDNNLSQLGWYTMMINLHETGWHTSGDVADWEHRYSSHIKNANVYAEAARWADGLYEVSTACYYSDIDHDGGDELVMHNDKVFMVFEGIGGKVNWIFYKNGIGDAFSVVSSDMAYWSETDGDYNESGSQNHFAALSDVNPNQQNSIYNINILQSFGDTVIAELDQWGVKKTLKLYTGVDYLDVIYDFYGQTGNVKSGWSPDLLDIIWSGKSHLQRIWGDYGSYCGYRNSSSGATVALVLGDGGASQGSEFEGTLVKGDEIYGYNQFLVRLFAGYTSEPYGTSVPELNTLVSESMDIFPPELYSPAVIIDQDAVLLTFNEAIEINSAELTSNYSFNDFSNAYTIINAERQAEWNKVKLTISEIFSPGDEGQIIASNVEDLNGNVIGDEDTADLTIPAGSTPHTIFVDGANDFLTESELIEIIDDSLFISWDNDNLYIGFYAMDLNGEGDFFVNIDTDRIQGSGATSGSWGRVGFIDPYLPEYQIAIEGGGGSMQVNNYTASKGWNYPGNGVVGSSYEGWSQNPFTEIAIPWLDLGNPEGFALSAHVSAEDSQQVPEVFPGINSVGNHPDITHWYAFFEPLIPGSIPLSGFIPSDVSIVPNSSPVIISYEPSLLTLDMDAGETQLFLVNASDAEGDQLFYNWILDGNSVGMTSSFSYSPELIDVGSHTLEVVVSDMVPGNVTPSVIWLVDVLDGGSLQLSLKVFLEGPFEGSLMQTTLNAENVLPLSQPYSGMPWEYSGTESVVSIPGIDAVDWILIELRDAANVTSANESTRIARMAAFVQDDGTVIGINGSAILSFNISLTENLFVVVWHRDHLAILSEYALTETGGIYQYDFSTSADQVYGGNLGYKQLDTGVWGMVGGDFNADGSIDETDVTVQWKSENGLHGYYPGDFGMDSEVNNRDKNDIWQQNYDTNTQILSDLNRSFQSQLPE